MTQRQAGDEESTIQHPLLDTAGAGNRTLNSEEEEDLPEISLAPYKSYAKYFWQCSKWLLLLCLFEIIAMIIWDEGYGEPWREQWQSFVWIVNTVFFFLAARAVDRDVLKVDEELQSDAQSGNENPPMDWNNYEHIYGRVARRIDVWLTSACRPHRVSTRERSSTTTSFLSHMCWIAWAICFASAYSKTLDSLFLSTKEAPEEIPRNTSSTFSNISHLSQSVQTWILDSPRTSRGQHFDFPHTLGYNYYDTGLSHYVSDDRAFTSDRGSRYSEDSASMFLTELVAAGGRLEKRVHKDIEDPRLFVPVQNSLYKDEEWRAHQYCFLSRSSLTSCQEIAHCVDPRKTKNGSALILNNSTLDWHITKEALKHDTCYEHDYVVLTASYKDLVLIHKSHDYLHCKEVIQLNATTMETSTIYHEKCFASRRKFHDHDYSPPSRNKYLLFFHGICGLLIASYYLVVKMGMVSGFFPLALSFSFTIMVLSDTWLDAWLYFVFLTIGNGVLLYSILEDRRWGILPAWLGKDTYPWVLYGIYASIAPLPFIPYVEYEAAEAQFVCMVLTGIILGHPICQALGSTLALVGVMWIITDFPFFLHDPIEQLIMFFTGLGLLLFGGWLSTHQEMIYARVKFMIRYFLILLRRWRRKLVDSTRMN